VRIKLTSIMVDDQDKAIRFYTEILGFKKKHDIPVGEYRWITVTSPEGPGDVELALEPNANPAGKTFQEAMFAQGIPVAAFEVADIAHAAGRIDRASPGLLHHVPQARDVGTVAGADAIEAHGDDPLRPMCGFGEER